MQSIIIKNKDVHFEPGPPGALTVGASPVAAGEEVPAPAAERCEKSVRLLQSDGLVHAIELMCSCGEVTQIELEYAEPESAEIPAPSETNS